jgi:spermidine synthase
MTFSLRVKIVHKTISPISGEIIVKEQLGRHTLYVGNIPQSGGIVRGIWKKGIGNLRIQSPAKVLLLGLGGGSVITLLKKKWPGSTIIAVEIDPEIITIAKTYFGLNNTPGLEIINDDALKVVQKETKLGSFDLIILDLYLGQVLPDFAEREDFLAGLKGLLTKKGVLVANHLLDKKGKETVSDFEKQLKKLFPRLKTLRLPSNQLFFAYQA